MQMPNFDQIKSAALPIVGAVGGAAVVIGALSPDQVHQVTDAFGQIIDGFALIGKGGGTLLVVGGSVWAVWRRTKLAVAASTQASPTETVITTDPKVAKAAPGAILARPGATVTVTAPIAPPSA